MFNVLFLSYSDRDYLKQKFAAYLGVRGSSYATADAHLEHWASAVQARSLDLPLADSEQVLATLSDGERSRLRVKMNTMQGHISRQYPLVAGEVVIEDTFTFLTEDYAYSTKATPLLIRKTNKATMVHVFHNLEFSGTDIVFRPEPPRDDEAPNPTPMKLAAGPSSIIISFFSGMAGAIGKKAGAAIFDEVFPNAGPDLDKVLAELQENIRNIFREELDAQTIDNLNYQLQGLIAYMQETYLPRKAAGADRPTLEAMLGQQNEKLYTETMALLTGERYRAKGIAYLVVGANAHLSILQEMANVDPLTTDPTKSSYITTYYKRLTDYVDALSCAINEVNTSRLTYLGPLQESTLHGAADEYWWFVDSWAKYTSPKYKNSHDCCEYANDAKKKATDARAKYDHDTFTPCIVTDLQPYRDTSRAWATAETSKK